MILLIPILLMIWISHAIYVKSSIYEALFVFTLLMLLYYGLLRLYLRENVTSDSGETGKR